MTCELVAIMVSESFGPGAYIFEPKKIIFQITLLTSTMFTILLFKHTSDEGVWDILFCLENSARDLLADFVGTGYF